MDVTQNGSRFETEYKPAFLLYALTLLVMVLMIIFNLIMERRRRNGQEREAVNIMLGGALIGIIANLLTSFIFPTFINSPATVRLLNVVGYIGLLVFALSIFWAITRKRLFDIRFVVARSVGYILTVGVLATVYGVVMFTITLYAFDIRLSIGAEVSLALATAIIGLSFPIFRQRFDKLTNHIFFRDSYVPRDLFDHVNAALVSSLELKTILPKVTLTISEEMKISQVLVAIRRTERGDFRVYGGDSRKKTADFSAELLRVEAHFGKDMLVSDEVLGQKNDSLIDFLSTNNISIVSPILSKSKSSGIGNRSGYIICGPRKSGNPFTDVDIKVLSTLSNEVALAIQNALHYEEIQQFNETLQQKVEEATRKLRVTNEKLKRMDETKDEFISMASHQLRTPLTSVKGYVSMVLEGDVGPINDQQRALLNQSFQSSQRMANLISDLLNLSRINTGKFVIDATPVHLKDIVVTEFEQLREMADAKNIDFMLDIPAQFPTLNLDDGKMHQVVMNLIDNALYYTAPGGKVNVCLSETPTTIEFRVVDTGIGVPRDAQKFLFSKMYRADNAQRARPDGTGLGLFLVKKVIVEQQGAIIFETEEGKGSTFGFRFNKKDHLVPETSVAEAKAATSYN